MGDWVLEDRETSAIEGHLGTWQEELARIASHGIKPGSGVDLQLERSGVVELYAIQSARNTKSSGGRRIGTTAMLSGLVTARAATEVVRIRADAHATFGDEHGNLDLDRLADPPSRARRRRVREA